MAGNGVTVDASVTIGQQMHDSDLSKYHFGIDFELFFKVCAGDGPKIGDLAIRPLNGNSYASHYTVFFMLNFI